MKPGINIMPPKATSHLYIFIFYRQ